MTRVSIVIAAYDEERNVEALTRRIAATMSAEVGSDWELVYVVDGTDRTREIVDSLATEIPQIRILYQREPRGLGDAFRRGFLAVDPASEVIVTMDADLNHQPEEIPRLLAAWRAREVDILVGSRFLAGSLVEGTPPWKRLLSGTMNVAMKYLYGVATRDKTSGFRVYRPEVLRRIRFDNNDFAFLPELLIRAHKQGLRISEEPITFIFRREGQSKMAFGKTCLSYLRLLRAHLSAGRHPPR